MNIKGIFKSVLQNKRKFDRKKRNFWVNDRNETKVSFIQSCFSFLGEKVNIF